MGGAVFSLRDASRRQIQVCAACTRRPWSPAGPQRSARAAGDDACQCGRDRRPAMTAQLRRFLARHRGRHPHARHDRRAGADLDRLPCLQRHHAARRAACSAAPSSPRAICGICRSRPRRSRSWRPAWCWSSSCATSICRSARSSASSVDDHRRRCRSTSCRPCSASTTRDLDHRGALRRSRSARRSARFKARSSPISAFPPSSSRWAASLFWRGAAWWVTAGQTIAPLDDRFALMGGGPHGSIGATCELGARASSLRRPSCSASSSPAGSGASGSASRCGRCGRKSLLGVLGCFVVLGATAIVNSYPWPERVARQRYRGRGQRPSSACPEGGLSSSDRLSRSRC